MNSRKIKLALPALLAGCMVIGMWLGTRLQKNIQKKPAATADTRDKLNDILTLLNRQYVDDVNTDSVGRTAFGNLYSKMDSLRDSEIEQILARLDPHSVYIPAKQLKSLDEDMKGGFAGIGVEFNIFSDTVHFVSIVPGGPSEVAGLQLGDKLLKTGDSTLTGPGISGERVRKFLRGAEGSKVTVTVLRGGSALNVTITRGYVALPSLDAAYMIQPGTGYIRLNKFSQTAYTEFLQALTGLKKNGMQRLILDLRGNSGGMLNDAVQISDEFLDGDKMIVYTEGRKDPRVNHLCGNKGLFETGKLVVMVDEESASASEIVAGAVQEWGRGTIVGRRSFGKGLVQRQFGLPDQSAVRLTIARYYTPSGRSIQRPYDKGLESYYDDFYEQYHNGSLVNADSVKTPNGKQYKTPTGRIVYGGGGIMPDVFVPVDTSIKMFPQLKQLYSAGSFAKFAYLYYAANKNRFTAWNSARSFAQGFTVDAACWNSFEEYCRKDSISFGGLQPAQRAYLNGRIKQSLARQIWRMQGLFEALNENDDMVKKALETVNR